MEKEEKPHKSLECERRKKKSSTSAWNVRRVSATAPTRGSTRTSTLGNGPMVVGNVGRVSAEAPTSPSTERSTSGNGLECGKTWNVKF
ncbi:hypothetical protein Nmel_003091 [Mimus melanotis]